MKDVGIVGLQQAGSSTIFTALTALPGAAPGRSNQAVVPVPDPRVDTLTKLHSSKKSVYTSLRFVETSGQVRAGARATGSLSNELLGHLRAADALLLVVRAFGGGDPVAQRDELILEFVYADLEQIIAKIARDAKGAKDADTKAQIATLEIAKGVLEAGTPLREATWDDEALRAFQGMAMLTLKPQVVVASVEDGETPLPAGMLAVAGALEAECAGMDPAEAMELLGGFGITERALPAVIRAVFDELELMTFLTAGDTESRAWEIRRGATAPEAAGAIHSDIQRGFIRADVVSFDDLVAEGSWAAARAKGVARQEGKAYVMREGDVVEFRFST